MLLLSLLFVIALASATFIDKAYGMETARALIYNARWMEIFYILLAVNLAGNVFYHKMWKKGKRISGCFHLSFFLILAGAGLTRYQGISGQLHFREGETTSLVLSDEAYLKIEATGAETFSNAYPMILSAATVNHWHTRLGPNGSLHIRLEDYIQNAVPVVRKNQDGKPVLSLRISDEQQTVPLILRSGEIVHRGEWTFVFDTLKAPTGKTIRFMTESGDLMIDASSPLTLIPMRGGTPTQLQAGRRIPVKSELLFRGDHLQFALDSFFMKGQISAARARSEPGRGMFSAIILSLSETGIKNPDLKRITKQVTLFGGPGLEGIPDGLKFQNINLRLSYGSLPMTLPFSLRLDDFIIERYPGSRMPSAYESQVTIIDPDRGIYKSFRIYMNHILKYRRYRFYQTSYDEDEMGSILTVTKDPGTPVTYAGYVIMIPLLIFILINPQGWFRQLGRNLQFRTMSLLPVILGLFITGTAFSQNRNAKEPVIDKSLAHAFGRLMVQDPRGRLKPIFTLSQELSDRLGHPDKEQELTSEQWILALFSRPTLLNDPLIPVNKNLLERLHLPVSQKFVSPAQLYDSRTKHFIFEDLIEQVRTKPPGLRTVGDLNVMKTAEQLQLAEEINNHSLFRCFPVSEQSEHWVSDRSGQLDVSLQQIIEDFQISVRSKSWNKASGLLGEMIRIQNEAGGHNLPSAFRREIEILYGQTRLFQRLGPAQICLGLAGLLFLLFVRNRQRVWLFRIVFILLVVTFIMQTVGLGMRWIASGHAPWTNKYESLVYISWTIMLAGLLFVKNSPLTILLSALFSGLFLYAANSGWANPQMTNLVPVLKSHWLITHVSVITASYGFFSLSALTGLSVLILMLVKPDSHSMRVAKKLTLTNERSLLIGLVLVTIGNILGAVWANESWGRYWGWDPKETWTLILIVIYAMLIHVRLVKKISLVLVLNSGAMFAYWAVLMTYIGVNFYLSGVHSYASGEAPPLPKIIFFIFGIQVFISAGAWIRMRTKSL